MIGDAMTLKQYATKHHNSASQIIVNSQGYMVCKVTVSIQQHTLNK